jgi:hypothetical protein
MRDIVIPHFSKLNEQLLKFVVEYAEKILTFRDAIKVWQMPGLPAKEREEYHTIIRNVDLWIDAYKLRYPFLVEFQLQVQKDMYQLGIERWPDYVYAESNHFKQFVPDPINENFSFGEEQQIQPVKKPDRKSEY